MIPLPIGIRMQMALQKGDHPLKLVDTLSSDAPSVKRVKKLIPQMCDVDPKKRPRAAVVADTLAECLGTSYLRQEQNTRNLFQLCEVINCSKDLLLFLVHGKRPKFLLFVVLKPMAHKRRHPQRSLFLSCRFHEVSFVHAGPARHGEGVAPQVTEWCQARRRP